MTKTNTIWKRLLSMALACIMVLGYIPVDAFAQEAVTAAPLTATLVLQDTIEEEVPVESSESEEPSEGEEPSEEPAPVAEVTYTYTYVYRVTVQDQTGADVTDSAAITWQDGTSGATLSTKNNTGITANVAYNGLTLAVSVLDTPVAWSAGASWSSIAAGSAIDAAVPVYGEGSGISGAVWTTVITDAAGNEIAAGIDAGAALINTPLTTTLTLKNGDTTLYTLTQTADVTYAAAEYTFSKESGWFTAMPEVVVTAVTAEDPALIAPVVVGEQVLNTWTAGETEGTYTITVPAAADEVTKTISAGDKSVTLNVDNAAVIVNSASAVADKDGTYVKFNYSVGKSGATANIGGISVALAEGTGTFDQRLDQVLSGTITITLTNAVDATASTTCDVVPYPSISHSGIITASGGVNYVAVTDPYVTFTVYNASGDIKWNVASGETTAEYIIGESGNTIKVKAPLPEGVNVTATDGRNRSVSEGLAAVAVDTTAPEITITGEECAVETHFKELKTYEISVTDDIMLGSVNAVYYLYGVAEPRTVSISGGKGSFTVNDGEHLKKIEVNAMDVSGNPATKVMETNVVVDTTAPVLTAAIAAYTKDASGAYTVPSEVTAIYSNNGKSFLKFGSVETNEIDGSIKVEVTFRATEANIPADSEWADGVKTVSMIVDENTVQEFVINGITLADKAGNVPVAPLAINIGGDDSTSRLEMALNSGVYSGSVYVDRRTPTDNTTDDNEVPYVSLSAKTPATTLGETRIFKGSTATFGLFVKDDSGLDVDVKAVVTGSGVSLNSNTVKLNADGTADINVMVAPGVEDTGCTLTVTVTDQAGNYYIYIEKFGVDSKAPVVSYEKVSTDAETAKSESEADFYQKNVTLKFAMTDLLPKSMVAVATIENYRTGETYTKNLSLSAESLSGTLTLTDAEWLKNVEITAADQLNNTATQNYAESLVVDAQAPVIADFVLNPSAAVSTMGDDGVLYYTEQVTVKAMAADDYFKSGVATYKLNADPKEVVLTDGEEATITVSEGDILTDLVVTATDKSGNSATKPFANKIAMDTTDPKITIEKTLAEGAAYIQTVNGMAYYDGTVLYTVTVEDAFIDTNDTWLKVNGKDVAFAPTLNTSGNTVKLVATFAAEDGANLKSIEFAAKDMGGRYAKTADIVIVDNVMAETDMTFAASGKGISYTGPQAVADTTAPELSASIAAYGKDGSGAYTVPVEITTIYTHDGKNYLKFASVENNDVDGSVLVEVTFKANEAYIPADSVWADGEEIVSLIVEENTVKKFEIKDIAIVDQSGNVPVAELSIDIGKEENKACMMLDLKDGVYSGSIYVDRRTPTDSGTEDTVVPVVTLTAKTDIVNAHGVRIFKGDTAGFGLAVQDHSGLIDTITAEVTGEGVSVANNTVTLAANGTAQIDVTVAEDKEVTDCTLTVTITDKGGNYYTYREIFGVDSKAPVITYEKVPTGGEEAKTEPEADFYVGNVSLKFEMADLIPDSAEITYEVYDYREDKTNDRKVKLTKSELDGIAVLKDGDWLKSVEITAVDQLGNEYEKTYEESIVVDAVAPVIAEFDLKTMGENSYKTPEIDGVVYFTGEVAITMQATDDHFKTGTINYKIDGTDQKELEMTDGEEVTITVNEGQMLTDLVVKAWDKSGNVSTKELKYSVASDTTDPEVTVVKELRENAKFIQHFDGKAYYNGEVLYRITVEDHFINVAETQVLVNNDATKVTWDSMSQDTNTNTKSISGYFYVENGIDVKNIQIVAKDMGGRHAKSEKIKLTDDVLGDKNDMSFSDEGEAMNYTGPVVVVDTTAPEAILSVSGNVESFYTRIVDGKEYFFVKMETPVEGDSDTTIPEKAETVNAKVVITDANLTTGNAAADTIVETSIGTATLTPGTGENKSTTEVVYTDAITVKTDETETLRIQLKAHDLAGNPMVLKVEEAQDGTTLNLQPQNVKGTLDTNLVIDRRRPTNGEESEKPKIDIKLPDNPVVKENVKKVPLYDELFDINVTVTDGAESTLDKNAGIQSISYEIVDKRGYLSGSQTFTYDKENDKDKTTENATLSETITVAVEERLKNENGERILGETDYATLIVTAIDNVGNKITKSVSFAVDTLAPRISGSYDNNDVQNEKYFKAKRTATITVEDLNFDATQTTINGAATTAEVWSSSDGKHTTTVPYETEGKKTFGITAYDLVKHSTTANADNPRNATWGNSVAVYAFVLDWTAPIIDVTYSANNSGVDGNGVSYYDQVLTAYITIKEVNFDPTVWLTTTYSHGILPLNAWTGEFEHKSYVTFAESNNYSFSIQYTDLAGNPATPYKSHVFSVDTHAPTINITRGDLSNDDLNIVQGDLVLGFTINDKQQNLSDYKVTVTHLNNDFKTTEVLGSEYYTVVTQEERTTVVVNFDAIKKDKNNDGLYTVDISARDYAGNTVVLTPNLDFSLNRFGSTFTTSDAFTQGFLATGSDGNVYHDSVSDKLVIQEINPNRVWNDSSKKEEGSILTVVVNGTSTRLVEGEDYTMSVEQHGTGNTKWYVYTYEIDPDSFKENNALVDGRYSILIYGEDEAGNKNTNESNVSGGMQKDADGKYTGKIEFVLDTTAPIITTTGIESGKNYNAEAQRMEIFLSDNTPATIAVYLNGTLINLAEAMEGLAGTAAWLVYNPETGSYILNVPELNTLFEGQNVRIVVTDAAGNETELVVDDFSVSTNFFVRMMNNGLLIGGVIVLMLLLILLLVFKLKRRKLV